MPGYYAAGQGLRSTKSPLNTTGSVEVQFAGHFQPFGALLTGRASC